MIAGFCRWAALNADATCAVTATACAPGQPLALGQILAQGLAVEQLERHDQIAIDLGAGQAAHDVRVVELGQNGHLVEEHAARVFRAR